jgi:leader peptidase (prepilin peptidase) / N-methyltransferase
MISPGGAGLIEPWFLVLSTGLLGLAFGSFLNVCVFRLPEEQSVVTPPSACPGCDEQIGWYDNIPVLSYVILRGKCRRCGTGISAQYPLVEITTAAIWIGMLLHHGATAEAAAGAIFLTLLFGIALTDARFYIIPNEFSVGGAILGLAIAPFVGGVAAFQAAVIGAASGYALLWTVSWVGEKVWKKEVMGGGDIKMMAMIGAFLGVQGMFLTLFLGALFGSVVFGPISLKTGKLVPFGIFLAAGAAITYAWGDAIVDWYLTSFLGMPAIG